MRGMRRGLLGVLFMIIVTLTLRGQEIKVSGGFLKDSVQIGEPLEYYLTARYPQSLTVLFPDSTFSFIPFEFNRKKFFPTQTSNGISYDSVLYVISTFEVDKVQYLNLPIFVTSAKDCTAYTSAPDSVYLAELIKNPPPYTVSVQNLPLKTNTLYEKVFSQFNYVILIILVAILLITMIVVWVVFGKRIRIYFKVRKLQKNHLKFVNTFTGYVQPLASDFSRERAEISLSLWKKYLEQLEQKPYTKLTTRETMQLEPNEQLGHDLQMIDRAIYGNQTAVLEPLQKLQQFAEERFHKKLEEVKHG